MNRTTFSEINTELLTDKLELINQEEILRVEVRRLERLDASLMSDICAELDPVTSKPLFSNAERRDAELLVRQTNSLVWTDAFDLVNQLRVSIAKLKAEISYKENDIKWGIYHAGDEINEHLASITARIEETSAQAAFAAVKHLLTSLQVNFPTTDGSTSDNEL